MDDSEQLRKFESYEGEVLENQGARWENFENTFSARPKVMMRCCIQKFSEKYDWTGVKDQIFDEIYAKLPLYQKDNKRDYEMESKLLNRLNLFNIYYKNSKSIAEQDLSGYELLAKSVDHSLSHGGTILHLAAEVKSRKAQSFAKSFITDYLDAKGLKIDKSEHGKYTIELDKAKKSRYFELKNSYMNALRNSLMYGYCAGVLTELPLLHQCGLDFQNKKVEHSNTDNITQLPDRDELIWSGWSDEHVNDFYGFAEEVSYDSLMLAMFANTISQREPNSTARRNMKIYSHIFNNSIKQISLSSFERALRFIEISFREIKLSYDIEKKEAEVIQTVMGFHSEIYPLLEVFQSGSSERIDIF